MQMTRWAVVAAVLALVSCGSSSSGGGGGSFTTSVPSDKPLNTLTPAETTTLCTDIGKAYSDSQVQQGSCKAVAFVLTGLLANFNDMVTDAMLRSTCMQTYNSCLSGGADGGAGSCMQPSQACTATVAELAACLKDSKAALVASFNEVPSCTALSRARLMAAETDGGSGGDPMETPACMTFHAKCPDPLIPDPSASGDGTQ